MAFGFQSNKWIRIFDVTEPRLHEKGYTVYKITSIVFLNHSPEAVTKIVVWKRYRSISHLHKEVERLHKNLQLAGECPPFPKAQIFNRFDPNVIEDRRRSSCRLFQFAAEHAPIFTSHSFQRFFESGEAFLLEDSTPTLEPDILPLPTPLQPCPCAPLEDTSPLSSVILSPDFQILEPHCRSEHKVSSESNHLLLKETSAAPGIQCCTKDLPDCLRILASPSFSDLTVTVENPVSTNKESPQLPSPQLVSLSPFTNSVKPDISQTSTCQYVFHAAAQIGLAQQHEAQERYEWAFSCYKTGISILVSGVQSDPIDSRREAVKRKTAAYLQRAEAIFHKHLSQVPKTGSPIRVGADLLAKDLRASREDLQFYKVLGIISKRNILVLDERSEQCYVIKHLLKSPDPAHKRTIIPVQVPCMVPLLKYIETEDAILLVLQYAKGGKLWDFVSPYFADCEAEMKIPADLTSEELVTNARQLLKSVEETLYRSQTNAYPDSDTLTDSKTQHLRLDAAFVPLLQRCKTPCCIPEHIIKVWAAELITAVERLHKWGITCCDLNPGSLLLAENGHLRLSYQSQWSVVDKFVAQKAVDCLYCAPEIGGVNEITPACDWWSIGVLLLELFTGKLLVSDYPSGVPDYFTCYFPDRISKSAQNLISGLLQYNPSERLGSQGDAREVKSHPFFRDFDWNELTQV